MVKKLCMAVMAMCMMLSCAPKQQEATTLSGLKPSDFTTEVEGKPIALYVLKNANGAEACVTNWGGRLVSLMVPDKAGKMTDVVLGYDSIQAYISSTGNFGALIGRYGNRIANAKFSLDGEEYSLPANDNSNCLHGGPNGFDRQAWTANQIADNAVELTYISKDGEAGFPGNLNVKVTYTLTDDNAMDIKYEATTDKKTIVNLTNHSYFNLSGIPGSTILDHQLSINADNYTPVDSLLIPTGIETVEGTPMDLRAPIVIGDSINNDFIQLKLAGGYDHNWVLNTNCDVNQVAATVYAPTSGILMEVYTNEPGLQIYCGNMMEEKEIGKHGTVYPRRGAICLESQHYPDSPNHPAFPSCVLEPGQTYHSECIYKFSVK